MNSFYYLLKRNKDHSITVSKWDYGSMPIAMYTVKLDRNDRHTCSCPSGTYRRYCKHISFVKAWLKAGEPMISYTE